jgi:uncharacterized coiled-coil DUF342 family protein
MGHTPEGSAMRACNCEQAQELRKQIYELQREQDKLTQEADIMRDELSKQLRKVAAMQQAIDKIGTGKL